jgi:dipeptidyl aminopeptidase/acylaminoacyl peptidase
MKPADLALLRIPGVPTLSPDGRRAVLAVTRPDLDSDQYRGELWLVEVDGSAPPRALTHGGRDSAPRWSPDGRWLAFLRAEGGGKPQLHVLPAAAGEPRRLTDHPLGAGEPVWSPDSARIAYVARVPEPGRYGTVEGVTADKEPPRRIATLNYRRDDVGFTLDRRPHVFIVDVLTEEPSPVQVTDGEYDDSDVGWSPDGSQLVFASARHADRDTLLYIDVYTCTPDGGDLHQVTRTTLVASRPAYTPDGREIVFLAERPGETGRDIVAQNVTLYAVPADGSAEPRPLTDAETFHVPELGVGPVVVGPVVVGPVVVGPVVVGPVVVGRGRAGERTGDEDGAAVLLAVERRGAVELVRVPLGGASGMPVPEPLVTGPRQVTGYAAAAGAVVATVADGSTAGELVAVRDGVERSLTSFGAQLAERAGLRPLEEITATAPDGYPVHGWLVRPDGPGPHPVLLAIHGGPFRQYGWTLFDEAQVYAGAGYAVVLGNPRGSSGYGQAHGRAIRHAMGTVDASDLLALLDAVLSAPDLDAARVGVMGGSYGGFMTSWLAAHAGHRFRAAIVERALTAWDSFTGSSDIGHYFTEAYAGTDPAVVAAQSPLSHAERIDIPVLIVHSEHDWRCPVEQAQRLFVALKRRGVETELLLFPGEGHELSRSGLPSHRLARFDAILDWWSRHLTA